MKKPDLTPSPVPVLNGDIVAWAEVLMEAANKVSRGKNARVACKQAAAVGLDRSHLINPVLWSVLHRTRPDLF